MKDNKLEEEYMNLFSTDGWTELESIDSNTTDGEEGFTLDLWAEKDLYVVAYGQIGNGFTDFCNVEFFKTIEDADKFIDDYNLRGNL